MNELILGLLGGGTFLQLINFVSTLGSSRRKAAAEARSSEVDILERTVNVVYGRLEDMVRLHAEERAALQAEISRLEKRVAQLERLLHSSGKEVTT